MRTCLNLVPSCAKSREDEMTPGIVIKTEKYACPICRMNGELSKLFLILDEPKKNVRVCERGHRIEERELRTTIISQGALPPLKVMENQP